ncbi:hypothetical protein [Jeotgalicoccus sp. FSL K6-3177]|uniref:hypothetical protein n=1 Tax=Jeotgalicoccus sp. FSL K6-3177 TaxID=2921494 RepID=UPI0030FDA790
MATESFTTDYKFNSKSAEKVVNAMDKKRKVYRANVNSQRVDDAKQIRAILSKANS